MSGFLGSYRHQIDEKGRLSLPASFRRGSADQPWVLVQARPEALTMYPEGTWAKVEERLLELRRREQGASRYVLRVVEKATEVVTDKQGRVLVPQRLLEAVGLRETALLVGAIDRVEIWDPERFEAMVAGDGGGEEEARFTNLIFD